MLVKQLGLAACTAATSSNQSTVVSADIAMQINQELDQLRANLMEQDCFDMKKYYQEVLEKMLL